MAKRKINKKYKRQSKKTIIGILAVLILCAVVILAGTGTLYKRDTQYAAQEEQLQSRLEEESQKADELAQEEIRVQTKEYIIEVAKSRLGLVNPGETVLRPNDDD